MSLFQWIRLDMKRLWRHKGVILAVFILPFIGFLLFASIASPLLAMGNGFFFPYTICDEDRNELITQGTKIIANSDSLKEKTRVYPADTYEEALKLLKEDTVAVALHIPHGFFDLVDAGRDASLTLIASPDHSLELQMVDFVLDGMISMICQGRTLLNTVKDTVTEAGLDESLATRQVNESIQTGFSAYLNRRWILATESGVSSLGKYLPMEYYVSMLLTFFCAMAMLPSIHLTSSDVGGPAIRRGLLSDSQTTFRFFTGRLVSCASTIFLTFTLLIIIETFRSSKNKVLNADTVKLLPLFVIGIVLAAFCFSALSMLIGTLIPRPQLSLWTGFYIVLLMAFLAGAFMGEGRMEPWLLQAGLFFPFRPAANIIKNSLYTFDAADCIRNILRLLGMTTIYAGVSFLLLRKRGRS